jgi:hypothetical protein
VLLEMNDSNRAPLIAVSTARDEAFLCAGIRLIAT